MKKKTLILALGTLAMSLSVFADDSCTVIGYHDPSTNVYDGPTYCTKVTLKGGIVVHGPLYASSATILGLTDISGPVHASHSQFQQIVSEATGTAEKITLRKNSDVSGDVNFKGDRQGTIGIDSTSKVDGKVTNGVITKL